MGRLYRLKRAATKRIIREAIEHHGLAKVISIKEAQRALRDPGYKANELGELRSTIRKLTEDEIIERLTWKATAEICRAEDERIFKELDHIAQHYEVWNAAERLLDGVSARHGGQ